MRQLISAACTAILRACPQAKSQMPAAVIATAVAALSANATSAGSPEPDAAHEACAVLASVELLSDQELTFGWNNTCGFPIVLKWRSQPDDGPPITGTLTLPPHQSGAANCSRCTLPEWTETRHGRESYGE
jgi:hypothetical protein